MFGSRQRGLNAYHLDRKQVWRIVKNAPEIVEIDVNLSSLTLAQSCFSQFRARNSVAIGQRISGALAYCDD